MAILFFSGAEIGTTSEAFATSGTFSVQSTTKRTGTYAYRTNPTTTATGLFTFRKDSANGQPIQIFNIATIYFSFGFYYATKPSSNHEPIADVQTSASTMKLRVAINSSGNILAINTSGTTLATSSTALSATTWYIISVMGGTGAAANWSIDIRDSTGALVEAMSGTGDQTATNAGQIAIGKTANLNGNTVDYYYDDLVIADDAMPNNNIQIKILKPNGDGFYPGTGYSATGTPWWGMLDEIPFVSSDYLLTSVGVGNKYTATIEDSTTASISGTIHSVKPIIFTRRDFLETNSSMVYRSGSTDTSVLGASLPSPTVVYTFDIANVDPSTSSAWTTSGLDSLEVGVIDADPEYRFVAADAEVAFTPSSGRSKVPIPGKPTFS